MREVLRFYVFIVSVALAVFVGALIWVIVLGLRERPVPDVVMLPEAAYHTKRPNEAAVALSNDQEADETPQPLCPNPHMRDIKDIEPFGTNEDKATVFALDHHGTMIYGTDTEGVKQYAVEYLTSVVSCR